MISTLVIDPGSKCLAWSVWGNVELFGAGLARLPKGHLTLGERAILLAEQVPQGADVAVVEQMFQYPTRGRRDTVQAQDKKANDLLDLQAIGAWVAGQSGAKTLRYYTAAQWKGQRPKAATKHLVEKTLEPEEFLVYKEALRTVPAGLRHNIIDSVGIGLRHHRRVAR